MYESSHIKAFVVIKSTAQDHAILMH